MLIDGGPGVDSGPKVCSNALSIGTFDIDSNDSPSGFISWFAPITGMLSDGTQMGIGVEFYSTMGGDPIGTGAFNLAEGDNANYSTCRICIRAFGGTQQAPKVFFPRAGTITLTEDPLSTRNLKATITGLIMEQVDIDGDTFVSTPIPTGDCANLPDSTADADAVPAAFTCDVATYGDGTTCNCGCGMIEPDCRVPGTTVDGCTAGQACWPDDAAGTTCVTAPVNDTCVSAEQLTVNAAAVSGTTIGATGNYTQPNTNTCTMYGQSGREVVYKVTLTAATAYTFTLGGVTNADHDPSLTIVGPDANNDAAECLPSFTTCASGTDAGGDMEGEAIAYTPTVGGTYYIIVDTFYQDSGGPFTIGVTQP